ncbi:alpha beta-hydrolase [Lecanosticta acicola]|uniref:Alpha beta-hydrolase n=1 Tax=Lecanosticta acicola TaxID=111012 RepID=A0AAI9ECZ4_9PEZI|nr:alpha beta-hydrolase [Lecanosticta acicola]
MEQLRELGTAIKDIIGPTMKTYEPLLLKNADHIRSIQKDKTTHTYGPHERQQLDVYPAPNASLINGRHPVLMFFYGGGLVSGNKTLPGYAGDLCHANIASFFGQKYGYTTVIPDYRLVNAHDAKFPSGGEDVALSVEWVFENAGMFGPEPIDLFLMGNSAGGIHCSTFLLHPDFQSTRQKLLGGNGTRLRGCTLLSVPFEFSQSDASRAEVLRTYFGDAQQNSPLGLLRTARENQTLDFLDSGLRVFVLNGELDPVNEIMKPRDDFVQEWLAIGTVQSRTSLAVDMMPGQNHISPFCSLGTGLEQEEAWGYQVAAFCDSIRKFAP